MVIVSTVGPPAHSNWIISPAIRLVTQHLVPLFLVGIAPIWCETVILGSMQFLLADQRGLVGLVLIPSFDFCFWLYFTGAQLILLKALLEKEPVRFSSIYLATLNKVRIAPIYYTLAILASTPELILPLISRKFRRLPCLYILDCEPPEQMREGRGTRWELGLVTGMILLICIEGIAGALTILAAFAVADRLIPRALFGLWSSSLWSAIFSAYHIIILAGVVFACRANTAATISQSPTDDKAPPPSYGGLVWKIVRWSGYVLLPVAVALTLWLLAIATLEMSQPHLVLAPRLIPSINGDGTALQVGEGPLIIIGPKWISLRVPETSIYDVVERSTNVQLCSLWLIDRRSETPGSLPCSEDKARLLVEGGYALFASLPINGRLRLSIEKYSGLILQDEALIPGGPAKVLDLDDRHEWALLNVAIAKDGTYRISADAISNADPEMELVKDNHVVVNDDKSAMDRNSELNLTLGRGVYKLAVRTWRYAPGQVRLKVEKTP